MKDLTQQEWIALTASDTNAVILDVRTSDEVADGIIPSAIHHDIYQPQEFMTALDTLDKSKNYYVYCRSGGRSAQACQIMNQLGFENTFNLLGGFGEWTGDTSSI